AKQNRAHQALAQFLRKVIENLVAWRLNILEQLLHELVVVIRQGLQHGEARGLLAVESIAFERHDLRASLLLVDECPFEREIDEARDQLAREGRNLAQQQFAARGRLQQ